jgi:hypothetical protein
MQNAKYQLQAPDSEVNSEDAWSEEAISKHNTGNQEPLPDSLRVGPPVGYTPKSSQEKLVPGSTTNPFLKKQNTGSTNSGAESSADVWGAPPSNAPPPPPSNAPPAPPVSQGMDIICVFHGLLI